MPFEILSMSERVAAGMSSRRFLRSILGTVPNQHVVILTMGKIHDTK
ncbi:hypothetical protein pJN226_0020 [Klebsiella phage pJN2-26]|uniref:Uncharacterized protein n=1 Tax=Klebsiella pneumoniae TaxID=573 RepID=A0A220SUU7_KLEPN|nr:hypothetical protein [Klebsiella pneumoniae]UAV85978.1 hypothetical protein pJN226_0020 [Klebsiella phage pJN2-26]